MIEDCMKYLWNELYLQYIPSSLYHYPQYNVISCNIKMILEHCSSSSSSTSVAAAGASSISPSSSSNNIFQVVYQSDTIHRKKLDFLESIIDSKGFELLIQRHGLALDYWSKKVT